MPNNGVIEVTWSGPYSWPGFEAESNLSPIPKGHGAYLLNCKTANGYIVYGVGITRRSVRTRLREHTKKYLIGDYTVLDMNAMREGAHRALARVGLDFRKARRNSNDAMTNWSSRSSATRRLSYLRWNTTAGPGVPGGCNHERPLFRAHALLRNTGPRHDACTSVGIGRSINRSLQEWGMLAGHTSGSANMKSSRY